jgi:hypothetical protein
VEEADRLNGPVRDPLGGEGSREEGERAWSRARVRPGCGSEERTRMQRRSRRGETEERGSGAWKEEEREGTDMWARAGSEKRRGRRYAGLGKRTGLGPREEGREEEGPEGRRGAGPW